MLSGPQIANAQYGTLAPTSNGTAAPTFTSQPTNGTYTPPANTDNSSTGGANLDGANPAVTSFPMNQFQTTGGGTASPL